MIAHEGFKLEKRFKYKVQLGEVNQTKFKASEIYDALNKYVIGQDEAKKAIANSVSNFLAAFDHNIDVSKGISDGMYIQRTNLLLVGNSGCGKTYIMNKLEELFPNLVVFKVDTSSLTQSGYVGGDVSSILANALEYQQNAGKKDSRLIIFLDEFDKISSGITDGDVSTVGVQRELLKLVEGDSHHFSTKSKERKGSLVDDVDTRCILWVFGGAFSELVEKKQGARAGKKVGFNKVADVSGSIKLDSTDIIQYGMLRELVGRIGKIVTLDKLDEPSYRSILLNSPDSPLFQYKKLAELKQIDLQVDDTMIDLILERAWALNIGARGIKVACDEILEPLLWS